MGSNFEPPSRRVGESASRHGVVITHKYSPQKGKGAKKRKIGSSQ